MIRREWTGWTVSLLLALVTAGGAAAAPVGMASHVKGKAELRRAGLKTYQGLRLLQRVEPGDVVRCGSGAEAVIVLFESGERFQIGGGKQGSIEAKTVKGARSLGVLSGPSADVARILAGARLGAFVAREAPMRARPGTDLPPWLPAGTRRFRWSPVPGAATYSFTLMDASDNVVWSRRSADPESEYPEDLPALERERPYLWRIVAFDGRGQVLPPPRWGIVTFLNREDAEAMGARERELSAQAALEPADPTPLVLLAEVYRTHGVTQKVLEALEELSRRGEPGAEEAIRATYAELGRTAAVLAGLP